MSEESLLPPWLVLREERNERMFVEGFDESRDGTWFKFVGGTVHLEYQCFQVGLSDPRIHKFQ